jgi:hypothetical protein
VTGAIQSGTKQRRDHQQEECCELRLPDGSFYFGNQPNMLDQFMVNKNMATGDAQIKVNPGTAQILKPPAMVDPGLYPKPIAFGGMGKPVNQNGFSDHFPITMTVTEVD